MQSAKMLSWWTDYEFMRTAIMAGLLVGAMCAALGVFVVQRNMAFLGEGLAHAAFGGVALGLLLDLGIPPVWVAIPFCIVVAIGIGFVRNLGLATESTAIGVFFSVSVALGIVFIYMRTQPTGELEGYLFGNILAVRKIDVLSALVLAFIVLLTLLVAWKKMAYIAFDRNLAKLSGIKVEFYDYLFLTLIACVIVLSVRTVGVILVSSYLIIPAAAAQLFGGSLFRMTIISLLIGTLGSTAGVIFSFYVDVPPGATIILTLAGVFIIGSIGRLALGR